MKSLEDRVRILEIKEELRIVNDKIDKDRDRFVFLRQYAYDPKETELESEIRKINEKIHFKEQKINVNLRTSLEQELKELENK